ncbi:uncharacterized protein [Rutidosis leptorrhynchoides]|uniref:uncharacterized protein n=1 Tax=Rutidosis leptorrhynchoides TaxID=125765 RepID=UPI003A99EF66
MQEDTRMTNNCDPNVHPVLKRVRFLTRERPKVSSLWGNLDCEFLQKQKVGQSGGQLLVWDTSKFVALGTFMWDSVIGVRGKWKDAGDSGPFLNVINIYGPHDDLKKQALWDSLSRMLSGKREEAWLLCGDFNEVREKEERFNCEFIEVRAKRFNDFILDNSLIEIPLGGRLFTRMSDDGLKFSKLNRFLVSEVFYSNWNSISAIAMDRKHSDHCPIMLSDIEMNFGPKPFKIFDAWFDEDNIEQVLRDAWNEPINVNRRKDCVFRNKLKKVKEALKVWSNKKFGHLDGEIEVLKCTANSLEVKSECGLLNESKKKKLWSETHKLWLEKEAIKVSMLQQKARVRWILDGDENSKYFHSTIKRKNNQSNIRGLNINGTWNVNPGDIKTEIFEHFKRVFESTNLDRPCLDELKYPTLSDVEAESLELPFNAKEIHEAILECGST